MQAPRKCIRSLRHTGKNHNQFCMFYLTRSWNALSECAPLKYCEVKMPPSFRLRTFLEVYLVRLKHLT